MSNANIIVTEISNYITKSLLKTFKVTKKEFIDFIELKWKEADDTKYSIYAAGVIMYRMVNEYIWVKDFNNMMRWLEYMDLNSSRDKSQSYIVNYFKGKCCLECGNEEKAIEYFNLCYAENEEYIFTREPFCYLFYNKHLENPRVLPLEESNEDDDFYRIVKVTKIDGEGMHTICIKSNIHESYENYSVGYEEIIPHYEISINNKTNYFHIYKQQYKTYKEGENEYI